jgi:hypothetical protein
VKKKFGEIVGVCKYCGGNIYTSDGMYLKRKKSPNSKEPDEFYHMDCFYAEREAKAKEEDEMHR